MDRNTPHFFTATTLVVVAVAASGCAHHRTVSNNDHALGDTIREVAFEAADTVVQTDEALPVVSNLNQGSSLERIADELDRVALGRLAAVQDLAAAEAQLRAVGFDRYPQILPSGSVSLRDGSPEAGISVEQMIWDWGRFDANLTDAELQLADAGLRVWRDRNEIVYSGLVAFISTLRYQRRLDIYAGLQKDLENLSSLLALRVEGGVADRGELITVKTAQQEVMREMLGDRTDLRRALADLTRLLRYEPEPSFLSVDGLDSVQQSCSRTFAETVPPQVALAEVNARRTETEEDLTLARRFPSLVLGAGLSFFSSPGLELRIDASDMLGLSAGPQIAAARARSKGAQILSVQTVEDVDAEQERLVSDYTGLLADIDQLELLNDIGKEAMSLYEEQIQSRSIEVTDGIFILRELADTELDLLDLRLNVIENCLELSRLEGTLIPFGARYE